MTTFSSGGFHGVAFGTEATFGIASGTTLTSLRHKSCALALSKETFQSAELRSDRQITDFRHGNQKPAGNIGFEFSYEAFDTFLEAALGGTWQSAYSKAVNTIAAGKTANIFYSSTATFSTFATGDVISVSGFTGTAGLSLNVTHVISGVSAAKHTLTISGTSLVTKAVGATVTLLRNPSLIAGTTYRSFSIERTFGDIAKYQQFTGCVINTYNLSVKPNAIVTGEFGILARGAYSTSTPWDSSPTAAATNSPYDSFTGAIYEGGAAIGFVTSIDLKLDNGGTPTYVIGDDQTPAIPMGRSNLTGSLDVYFADLAMLRKFEDEAESSVEFYLGTGLAGGKSYRFYLPRVKYGTGDNPASDEKPIILKMNYQAIHSPTHNTNIRITKIA
jgi:hypothetical protein